ncbi:MAG TPA: DedA family protein [Epsilonproteobacteria bacterium]|nr:DedA family protein [Campylobacterota bacterium]
MDEIAIKLVAMIGDWGYLGIFILMFLESSFFPFPSEVVMIPAGYLAYKGEMNLVGVLGAGVAGSVAGALFNYWLAMIFGRAFLLRYGKYFFFSPQALQKLELFFAKHGEISTFNGRLIPAVRQYISLPAGLAKMSILKFVVYTSLGASIWMAVLVGLGYFIGSNEELIREYFKIAIIIALLFVAILTYWYIRNQRDR